MTSHQMRRRNNLLKPLWLFSFYLFPF